MDTKNITLEVDNLKKKYGDTKVMVLSNEDVFNSGLSNTIFIDNFTLIEDRMQLVIDKIFKNAKYMLRYNAEVDINYKQPIPYIILIEKQSKYIFCMKRIGGDDRLVGYNSIGLGGHIDENEDIYTSLLRELSEEVGLSPNNIMDIKLHGIIMDTSNRVGSVHMGFLYTAKVDQGLNVECIEKEKLHGSFVPLSEINKINDDGKFETWSNIAYKYFLCTEKFRKILND